VRVIKANTPGEGDALLIIRSSMRSSERPQRSDRPLTIQYSFTPVNLKEINAFALPGGPMFVYRGMFDAAAAEGEVAGVLAHELSHVLLRHGTANASKAQNPWLQIGQLAGAIGAPRSGEVSDPPSRKVPSSASARCPCVTAATSRSKRSAACGSRHGYARFLCRVSEFPGLPRRANERWSSSPRQAITGRPDFIVTETRLAGINGYQLCELSARRGSPPTQPQPTRRPLNAPAQR
jgi:peptidase M48-like protein